MTIRIRFLSFIATISLLAGACSGGDDDDRGQKTPATCAAICAQQNGLCGTKDDCDARCSTLAQILGHTGCDAEFQEGLDCLSEKNVCDEDETACPAMSFDACIDAYCASAAASDPVCRP
jgi:hypothetical protein